MYMFKSDFILSISLCVWEEWVSGNMALDAIHAFAMRILPCNVRCAEDLVVT